MLIMLCDYWQTNISLYVQTDLNANGFTTEAEKVRGRSLLNCKILRISLIQGHRTGTSKLYQGYPITQENVKQRQIGDIYLPAYFMKGHESTLFSRQLHCFLWEIEVKFLGVEHQLKLNLSGSSSQLPPERSWQDRHLQLTQQQQEAHSWPSFHVAKLPRPAPILILFPPPFPRLPSF